MKKTKKEQKHNNCLSKNEKNVSLTKKTPFDRTNERSLIKYKVSSFKKLSRENICNMIPFEKYRSN